LVILLVGGVLNPVIDVLTSFMLRFELALVVLLVIDQPYQVLFCRDTVLSPKLALNITVD
tara:strand:- start:133 stop:312 length:180 start_codon:yes stop_codon:yes gene_type:complete